jgi:hypothetical protein
MLGLFALLTTISTVNANAEEIKKGLRHRHGESQLDAAGQSVHRPHPADFPESGSTLHQRPGERNRFRQN